MDGGLTKTQVTSRPETTWTEVWSSLSKCAQMKAKQQKDIEVLTVVDEMCFFSISAQRQTSGLTACAEHPFARVCHAAKFRRRGRRSPSTATPRGNDHDPPHAAEGPPQTRQAAACPIRCSFWFPRYHMKNKIQAARHMREIHDIPFDQVEESGAIQLHAREDSSATSNAMRCKNPPRYRQETNAERCSVKSRRDETASIERRATL